jgi:alkylhydroperoxidase family enzyme
MTEDDLRAFALDGMTRGLEIIDVPKETVGPPPSGEVTAGQVLWRPVRKIVLRKHPIVEPDVHKDRPPKEAITDATHRTLRTWQHDRRSRHGYRPELLEAWESLKDALLGRSSTLSPQLKEEVRRTLAQRTGCQFCASLGQPAPRHASRQESLAVAFADAVGEDHTAISDAQVNLLLEEFTVPQLVELLIWISFEHAGQMFGCLIGDEPATAEDKQAFAASITKP